MTSSPAPARPISSTPILRTVLIWSGAVTGVLAILAAVIGFAVAGTDGMWSALAGVLVAAVFLAITSLSILIANRWYGDPLYVPIFFGIVLGGWLLKFVIFIVALLVLRQQPWLQSGVFLVAVIVSVVGSLVVDVIVMLRLRVPAVSDTTLPTTNPEDEPIQDAAGDDSAPRV